MIIDIRGTHGSGKSWVMHQLLKKFDHEAITGYCEHKQKEMTLGYYLPEPDAAIIGRYSNQCGGCDGVGSAGEVCRRVRMFSKQYERVLLEGILVAHTFKRYSELAEEIEEDPTQVYKFLFLDTPLEVCIERVKARRIERGNTKEFDPKNVIHDYRSIWERTRKKMQDSEHYVVEVPYKKSLQTVLKEMELE